VIITMGYSSSCCIAGQRVQQAATSRRFEHTRLAEERRCHDGCRGRGLISFFPVRRHQHVQHEPAAVRRQQGSSGNAGGRGLGSPSGADLGGAGLCSSICAEQCCRHITKCPGGILHRLRWAWERVGDAPQAAGAAASRRHHCSRQYNLRIKLLLTAPSQHGDAPES